MRMGCLFLGVRVADAGEPRCSGVGPVALSDVATIVSTGICFTGQETQKCISNLSPHDRYEEYYVHVRVVWGFRLHHPRERSRSTLCSCTAAVPKKFGNLATQPSPGRDIFAVVRRLPREPRAKSLVQALTKVLEPRPNQAVRVNRRSGAPGRRSP